MFVQCILLHVYLLASLSPVYVYKCAFTCACACVCVYAHLHIIIVLYLVYLNSFCNTGFQVLTYLIIEN